MRRILFEVLIYGMCFIPVIGISYVVGLLKRKRKTFGAFVLSAAAILIVCLFAGLRADTVGTDIKVYAKPVFEGVQQHTFSELTAFRMDIDYGFKLLAFLVAQTTDSIIVFLFFVQLLTFVPVYIVAYKQSSIVPIWLTVLVYLCIFYCASFNLMRQSICGAMLLLAYACFEEKKYIKTVALIAIASFFHGSAIIGVGIYAIGQGVNLIKKVKTQRIITVFSIVAITAAFTQWNNIFSWMINIGILPEKYRVYYSIFSGNSNSYLLTVNTSNYIEVFYRCAFAFFGIMWGYKKNVVRRTGSMAANVNVAVICAMVCLLTMIILNSSYGLRVVWNNEFVYLMLLPRLMTSKKLGIRHTNTRFLIIIAAVVSYFFGYIILGWHGVVPLRFAI